MRGPVGVSAAQRARSPRGAGGARPVGLGRGAAFGLFCGGCVWGRLRERAGSFVQGLVFGVGCFVVARVRGVLGDLGGCRRRGASGRKGEVAAVFFGAGASFGFGVCGLVRDVVLSRWKGVFEGGRRERGAGTVWVVAFVALVWLVGIAAVAVGGIRVTRQRAEVAADLAALAGAARLAEGEGAACRRAGRVVAASRGRLSGCRVRGRVVEVEVTMVVRGPGAVGMVPVVSRARAGPVGPEGVTWRPAVRCTECQ
ncbi:Rv3654c family TadE-like protein [Actinomadura hibisca]|uniref:Rv3654c family TadE-like protein n=1 Tax=Actinomadura hibisca TaxID=68565 RepID=UPI000A021CEC|nr:Rv3654c family TadE-like protein [Actinomadura hibisca]